MNKRLWGGAFTADSLPLLEEYSNSIQFDWQLANHDIAGSIAHVTMLAETKIISELESQSIIDGLKRVQSKLSSGEYSFSLSDEDVHMNIERLLHQEVGDVAGKLHTARSRNDQVALDMHLYVREQYNSLSILLTELQQTLLGVAEKNLNVIIPGYTHLQRAQPILFSHHLLAYFWMFERDRSRVNDAQVRNNISPLGAGALAGTTFPIDRKRVADLLQFAGVYENSLDAVSDRDFVVEFHSISSLIMVHLSRLSEEIILWSSGEFHFIKLHDTYSTGSSIMPQKKNADHAELIRGKSGRVFGHLSGFLTTLKGLPLAYNKDMQEDKEGLFDTVKTVSGALQIMKGMISTLSVNAPAMLKAAQEDFSNATDMADFLAAKGLPFRQAHEITAKLVAACSKRGCRLEDLSLSELHESSVLFDVSIFDALKVENVVSRRNSYGGTASTAVAEQIEVAKATLTKM